MKATLTALIAAIEAAAVALAGLVVVAIPAALVWWITLSLEGEPTDVVAVTAAVWLLGHLVPLQFSVPPETALQLGIGSESLSVVISLAPLALTVLTAALAFRAGWRFARRGGLGAAGALGGTVGFACASGAIVTLAHPLLAWSPWLAVLVATCCFGLPACLGFVLRAASTGHEWWRSTLRVAQRGLERVNPTVAAVLPARLVEVLRFACAACAALLCLGALGLAVALTAGYIQVVTLSQGLQLDVLGAVVLFIVQLALTPNAWVWAIAWFSGAGFAIGEGTSVTPFETLLGPVPALPLLGALPQGWGAGGALAPAIVVLVAIGVGTLVGARPAVRRLSWLAAVIIPLAAAGLAGLVGAGLGALSGGSLGPDRLAVAGPDPWLVGGLIAAELGVGLVLGVIGSRIDYSQLTASIPLPSSGARAGSTEPAVSVGDGARVPVAGAPAARVAPAQAGMSDPSDQDETQPLTEWVPRAPAASGSLHEQGAAPNLYSDSDSDPDPGTDPGTDPGLDPHPATTSVEPDATGHAGMAETGQTPDPGEPDSGAESTDEESLLRAYAWDATAPPEEKPARWRWRMPKR